MGIVVSFVPRGSIFRENSFYRAPGDKWAQEIYGGCPQQRHATEEPGKIQGRDRVGLVEGSCVYLIRGVCIRGPRGQYSEKIRSIEKPVVQD